jgi:hypothetical protein
VACESLLSLAAKVSFAVKSPHPTHAYLQHCHACLLHTPGVPPPRHLRKLTDVRVAGADISEISALDAEAARGRRYLEDLCTGMRSVRKPVIAAVEGMAVSGKYPFFESRSFVLLNKETSFGSNVEYHVLTSP